MSKICVVGSINIDIVNKVDNFPKRGETITSRGYHLFYGGKGANQAVAASRLGADVTMLGKVGSDTFGIGCVQAIKESGVDVSGIHVEQTNTGVAVVTVDSAGNNTIIISGGANTRVDIDYVKEHISKIDACDIVMLQLEIPYDTVKFVAEHAKSKNKIVILDPAPAVKLDDNLLRNISILTPNENEIRTITSVEITGLNSVRAAGNVLLRRGVGEIILKAGEKGAYLIGNDQIKEYKSFKVNAIDTTAAGDSFNGGLAYAMAENMSLDEAIRYASAVAAMSVTKMGAQSAMPIKEEVRRFMSICREIGRQRK